jgi:hypothetical protein
MIAVLADDMTGAAEIAGAALSFGLSAEIQIDSWRASENDVVIVDSNTRACEPAVAAQRLREITRALMAREPDLIYKKVDSVLRGSVGEELRAVRTIGGFDRSLLVCANPRKGRTTEGGRILVDGVPLDQTRFAHDPEHPRHSCRAAELVWNEAPDPGDRGHGWLQIADASGEADLRRHAARGLDGGRVLLAGGGEFFEAVLLQQLGEPRRRTAEVPLTREPDSLLVSGSSLATVDRWPIVAVDPAADMAEIVAAASRTLSNQGQAAIRCDFSLAGTPRDRTRKLVEIVASVLANCRPEHVWVEGGQTASSLVRVLGYSRFSAIAVHGDGVVRLMVDDPAAPQWILKPGSYAWPSARPRVAAREEIA